MQKNVRAADVVRAIFELARARLLHNKLDVRKLNGEIAGSIANDFALPVNVGAASGPVDRGLVGRIQYLVPRLGKRVPWRADCLVQAMAARRWLAAGGVGSRIHLGFRMVPEAGFEAHAWLTVDDEVVTGWDIAGFDQFREFPLS